MADFGSDLLKSVTFELGPGHRAGWFRTFRGCVGQVSCDGCGVHGSFSYTFGPIWLCEAQQDPFRAHEVDKLFPRNQDGSGYEKQVFRWNRSLVRKEVRVCPLEALELAGMRWF